MLQVSCFWFCPEADPRGNTGIGRVGGEPTFASRSQTGKLRRKRTVRMCSAAGAVGGDQRVCCPPKQRGRFSGLKYLRTDKCAIDEHRELTGKFIGSSGIQPFGDALQAPTQLALVCLG